MSSNILENSLKHSGRFSTSKLGRLSMGYSHIEPFSLRNTAFSKPISTNSLQNISRGAIELHLKDFLFNEYLRIFQIFYSVQYILVWYTTINHEHHAFTTYDSVCWERTKQFSTTIKIS